MDKDKCVEALKGKGFDAEVDSSGVVYCYGCADYEAFRQAVRETGYDRSFGATKYRKGERTV